jgi:hypothetical protein
MIYSRFNDQTAVYEVFEDSSTHALNGDLPVPQLGAMAGKIGVPATEAGRPLPTGARRVGTSWKAKGMVVRAGSGSLGSIDKSQLGKIVMPVLIIGTGIWMALWLAPRLTEDE